MRHYTRLAVDQHGAGAALPPLAPHLGACETEFFPEDEEEGPARLDQKPPLATIDQEPDPGHLARVGRFLGCFRSPLACPCRYYSPGPHEFQKPSAGQPIPAGFLAFFWVFFSIGKSPFTERTKERRYFDFRWCLAGGIKIMLKQFRSAINTKFSLTHLRFHDFSLVLRQASLRTGYKGSGRKKHPGEMPFHPWGGVTPPLHSAGWAARAGTGRSPLQGRRSEAPVL
jgi:hypothetical protein